MNLGGTVLAWTVFVMAYVLLALLCSLGLRRLWRNPPDLAMGNGWIGTGTRGNQRAIFPTTVMIFAMAGVAAAAWASRESHGLAAVLFSLLSAVFSLGTLVAVLLVGSVRWFNWPTAVVPPGLRAYPGMAAELKGRWLRRPRRR